MSSKKGLVLGGGGSKGSYEAGVVHALNQLGYTFDIIAGTSIGSLCGAITAQNNTEALEKWVSSFTQANVSDTLFMFPNQYETIVPKTDGINEFLDVFCKNGPSIQPLMDKFETVFSYDEFMKSNTDFACVSYNITKEEKTVFYKKDMTKDDVLPKLFSSTAYFPAFNFVEIEDSYYADGGYCDNVPIDICKGLGADDIIAVDISDFNQPDPENAYQASLLIRPLLKLHYYLDFEAKDLVPQMNEGYLETLKYMNAAPGYLYTFYEEDWKHMQHLERICMSVLASAGGAEVLTEFDSIMKEIYSYFLGYQPRPLKNKFSNDYIAGKLLEVLGMLCGIDPLAKQYHFRDFIHEILEQLYKFESNPNEAAYPVMFKDMEMKAVKDLLVFFHTALVSYHNKLPEGFGKLKEMFLLPYYMAYGWIIMEKFKLALYL